MKTAVRTSEKQVQHTTRRCFKHRNTPQNWVLFTLRVIIKKTCLVKCVQTDAPRLQRFGMFPMIQTSSSLISSSILWEIFRSFANRGSVFPSQYFFMFAQIKMLGYDFAIVCMTLEKLLLIWDFIYSGRSLWRLNDLCGCLQWHFLNFMKYWDSWRGKREGEGAVGGGGLAQFNDLFILGSIQLWSQ